MKEKEKLLTEQEREEMYREFREARPGKEARAFHKKYKVYGWRISFFDRYPHFTLCLSIFALLMQFFMPLLRAIIERLSQ